MRNLSLFYFVVLFGTISSTAVFVIHFDKAVDRYEAMMKQFVEFADLNYTVPLEFVEPSPPEILEKPFHNVDEFHKKERGAGNYVPHKRLQYSTGERSILATHRSIACNAKSDYIVMEDDILLFPNYFQAVQKEIKLAPKDSRILQFHIIKNSYAKLQLSFLREPFVKWVPEYWGAAFVWISKDGAKELCKRKVTKNPLADYWLYEGPGSYTHTRSWFGTDLFQSRVNEGNIIDFPLRPPPTQDEIKNKLILNTKNSKKKLPRILALTTCVSGSCENAIKNSKILNNNYFNGDIDVKVRQYKTKDYSVASEYSRQNPSKNGYEWVLLFNENYDFTLYPFETLFVHIRNIHHIIGLTYSTFSENGAPNKLKPDPSIGRYGCANSKFYTNYDLSRLLHPFTFINNGNDGAVLIRSSFFEWYIKILLNNNIVNFYEKIIFKKKSYGIENMWCEAASVYSQTAPNSGACSWFSIPVFKDDGLSLADLTLKLNNRNQSVRDSDRNKQKNIEAVFQEVRRVNSTLASWWRASELQRTTDCRKSYLRKPDNKKK
jgi:hypothetical protein